MTAARVRNSQSLMSNSETKVERLEGVTALRRLSCKSWDK